MKPFEFWSDRVRGLSIKIWTTFYRRMFFLIRLLNDPIPAFHPSLSVEITALNEIDAPAYRRLHSDQPFNLFPTRLSQGDQCFAVWYHGDIVHGTWTATGQVYIPYLRRSLILSPKDVYIFNIYTMLDYRKQGLAVSTGAHIMQYYWEHGYRRITALVAVENEAGLEMLRKLGYQPMGLYRSLRLGPWQWDWQQTWGEEFLPILIKSNRGKKK